MKLGNKTTAKKINAITLSFNPLIDWLIDFVQLVKTALIDWLIDWLHASSLLARFFAWIFLPITSDQFQPSIRFRFHIVPDGFRWSTNPPPPTEAWVCAERWERLALFQEEKIAVALVVDGVGCWIKGTANNNLAIIIAPLLRWMKNGKTGQKERPKNISVN